MDNAPHDCASALLLSYLFIPPVLLRPDGRVMDKYVGDCIGFLIENGVFGDVSAFKAELAKQFSAILPEVHYERAERYLRKNLPGWPLGDKLRPVSDFLRLHLHMSPDFITPDGTVRPGKIRDCMEYLIDCGEFDCPEKIKGVLWRDYGVVLPEWCYSEREESA